MRKLTALLLAMLMMALPFAGVAEEASAADSLAALLASAEEENYIENALADGRRVSATFTLGNLAESFLGEPAIDQVIADVLNALSVSGYVQGDEFHFSLGMKQETTGEVADILSLGVAADGESACITSNLLGSTVIRLGLPDVLPLLERVIGMLADFGMIGQDEADEIIAALKEEFRALDRELAAVVEMAGSARNAELDLTSLDFTALIEAVTPLMEKVQMAEVNMQPRNADMAVTLATLTITPEEFDSLLTATIRFLQQNPALMSAIEAEMGMYMMQEFGSVYGETPTLSEVLEEAAAELENENALTSDVNVSVWLDEAEMPVAAEIALTAEDAAEAVTLTYNRLTVGQGVSHCVKLLADGVDLTFDLLAKEDGAYIQFSGAEAGATAFTMTVDALDRSAENLAACDVNVMLDVMEGDETMSFGVKVVSDTVFNGVDFAEKDAITLIFNGKEYGTLFVDVASGEPGASIRDGRVVNPVDLSEADFANWFVEVYNSVFGWVSSVIYALPASVMNLVTSLMY